MTPRNVLAVQSTWRSIHPSRRQFRFYSSQSVPEQIVIPCFSNGSITLELVYFYQLSCSFLTCASIHNPPQTTLEGNDASSVVLYLPPGPPAQDPERDSGRIESLRTTLYQPVVKINYRCSQQHRFPTPIHDVLAGYDWVLDNLLPKRSIVRARRSETVGRVSVYGEHIGGGLAAALALTECHAGQPGVVAAMLADPVLDWASLGRSNSVKKAKTTKIRSSLPGEEASSIMRELLTLRSELFTKPAHYFDPFASPILFFRSPGIEVPKPPPERTLDDLEQLSIHEREAYELEKLEREATEPSSNSSTLVQGRRTSRRFPNKTLGLRLPSFYISSDQGSPLAAQAEELASQLMRSFVRQRKDAIPGAMSFGRKVLLDSEEDQMTEVEKGAMEAGIEDWRKKVKLDIDNSSGVDSTSDLSLGRFSRMVQWLASSR